MEALKTCVCGKLSYPIYDQALTTLKQMTKDKKMKLEIYKCAQSGSFHITAKKPAFVPKTLRDKIKPNEVVYTGKKPQGKVLPVTPQKPGAYGIETTYKPFEKFFENFAK